MGALANGRLLKLIRAFLNAGVMENGLVSPSVEGTPQGGPLSPLLSNLVLDELDRELELRGRYVRYADDSNIYVRSKRAGQRVMKSITQFITQKLKLKVNALFALGVRPRLASNTAGSGRGSWYLAHAKALSVALSSTYFKSLGLPTPEVPR